ncbi:MAG: tetratricopeptide repeat protein [Terriglobales bacterium]
MNRHTALLSIATLTIFLGASAAQTPPTGTQNPPALGETAPRPARVGPPPHSASAAQLEIDADTLRAEKSYADAIDYYRAAIKKSATAGLWNKIGITELQFGRHKDAIKSFNHAIKLDPKLAEAFNNRGAVYYISGAQQQALAGRAGKSVPGGALKNYRKAVSEYQKALAIREDNASYHSNLGTAYFALREFPAAIAEYVRAMQIDPQVFEHRSQTGIAAQMSSPEDRAYYSFVLARIYAKAGDLDRALEYLRKAMEDGYKEIDSVYKDQEFAMLRKDPRFAELMSSKPAVIPQ